MVSCFVDSVRRDGLATMRSLRRQIGGSVVVIGSLTLAIASATLVGMLLDAIYLTEPPFRTPGELVALWATDSAACAPRCMDGIARADFERWRPAARSMTAAALYHTVTATVFVDGTPQRLRLAEVTGEFFGVLGTPPERGRVLLPGDNEPGAGASLVLGARAAKRLFGSVDASLGRAIDVSGSRARVVGVMPAAFRLPDDVDAWVPAHLSASRIDERAGVYLGYGRLRPGADLFGLRHELARLMRGITEPTGAQPGAHASRSATAEMLIRQQRQISRTATNVLIAAGVVVFLLGCVNAQSLLLVRGLGREHEWSVRTALGARPANLVRTVILESAVLSAAAGVAAAAIVTFIVPNVEMLVSTAFEIAVDFSWSVRTAMLVAALAAAAAALSTAGPLAQIVRLDFATGLRADAARAGTTRRERLGREIVTTAQVAVALVMVSTGGLVARSLQLLSQFDLGLDIDRIVVATLVPPDTSTMNAVAGSVLADKLRADLGTVVGTRDIAAWRTMSPYMLRPADPDVVTIDGDARRSGRTCTARPGCMVPIAQYDVSPGMFAALGAHIVRGREFTTEDRAGASPVAIVNAIAAERWWPGGNPLGKRFRLGGADAPEPWLTVVGVYDNPYQLSEFGLMMAAVNPNARFLAYFRPIAQTGPVPSGRPEWAAPLTIGFRAPRSPASLEKEIRARVHALAPTLVVERVATLRHLMLETTWLVHLRLAAKVVWACAGVAVLLALVGVHGVVADATRRRTRESAIRIALGARAHDILLLVARQGLQLTLAGLLIGATFSVMGARFLASVFFAGYDGRPEGVLVGVGIVDFGVLGTMVAAVVLATTFASVWGARGAVSVDPNIALRTE